MSLVNTLSDNNQWKRVLVRDNMVIRGSKAIYGLLLGQTF